MKLAREKGMPTTSANFGMYDSMKESLWNWNIYIRDYSCFLRKFYCAVSSFFFFLRTIVEL